MKLKELIEKRWQASAEGYGESIRKELSDEREKWKDKAEDLIDYMRDKYGFDDNVERIISMYYLDRL